MVEEVHEFFKEIFDWCYPELECWTITEYSDGIYMTFNTIYRSFTIRLTKWNEMTLVEKHKMKIKLCHNVFKDK